MQQSGKWLNATDAARYAGVPVAILKKAVDANELHSCRLTTLSKRKYIHTTELDRWMDELLQAYQK
jgi:hypothetical protein